MANKKYPYETDGPLKDITASYPGGLNIQVPKTAQQQAKDLLGQINNRPGFQYDPSTDPLWQNIRSQYVHNGQRAMEDTMGQAAGLTGGYGSTYAQGAGQQAYNEYLLGLNGELATAYDRARTAYDADTADLYNRYNLALGAAQDEYNRGRDALADERYAQEYADDQAYREWQMRQAELDRQDQLNKQSQNMAYEMAMNMISTGQTPSAELLAQAGVSTDYARSMAGYYAQQAALAAGGGSSGGGNDSQRSYTPGKTPKSPNPPAAEDYISDGLDSSKGGTITDAQQAQMVDYAIQYGLDTAQRRFASLFPQAKYPNRAQVWEIIKNAYKARTQGRSAGSTPLRQQKNLDAPI